MSYKIIILLIVLLFLVLNSFLFYDLYRYYFGSCRCCSYVLRYNLMFYTPEARDVTASVILHHGYDNRYRIICDADEVFCNIVNKSFSIVANASHTDVSGYRFDSSPSYLLYKYRGGDAVYSYIVDVYGVRIPIFISIFNRYSLQLLDIDASYRCFELNKPFYIYATLFNLIVSIVIVVAIYMAYRIWSGRGGGKWRWE